MHILLLHHVVEDRWPSNSRWFLPSFSFPFFCTVHGILQGRILEWVAIPLLQGIFPTQGLNPGLPHCRQILYQLSHKGSPKILEWVAYPFSRGCPQPRNRTRVSWIAGGFFTWVLSGKPPFWTTCLSKSGSYKATLTGSGILKVKVLLAQSCLTLWNRMDCSPPGYSVHGIFQARILEWVAIFLLQANLPNPGIEPRCPALQADSLPSKPPSII